jgi:predicted nucleic acid-binding protein
VTVFADTNWVVATYFIKADEQRTAVVERFMRQQGQPLIISHIVLLECSNVFPWTARERNPAEWDNFQTDLGRKFLVDTMQWDMLRPRTGELCERYSHRGRFGTFDLALVASALLTGAQIFASFDSQCRALAAAQRLKVFPKLLAAEKQILAGLR